MIQLYPVPRPLALTDELVRQLTTLFKADKTQRVWNKDFIKSALLNMSSGKCCYCECRIDEESKYMEVEHFRCKDIYEDDVVLWSNLLPSCKRCNGYKDNHDTGAEPIVHPVNDDPRNHLELRAYRFYGKTPIGKMAPAMPPGNWKVRWWRPYISTKPPAMRPAKTWRGHSGWRLEASGAAVRNPL